jgi:predicted ATPase
VQQVTGAGHKIYLDFQGASAVPAHCASHGTLIALALLTILYGPHRPDLLLLDDFDHALHPRAQLELVKMLKELLVLPDFADLQIAATTHSPYVLDKLGVEDVRVFALREDGTVAMKSLAEQSAKRVLDALTGDDPDRVTRCWKDTPLETLRERGEHNGLKEYLEEVGELLGPRFSG